VEGKNIWKEKIKLQKQKKIKKANTDIAIKNPRLFLTSEGKGKNPSRQKPTVHL
jgi:hypothetical protein